MGGARGPPVGTTRGVKSSAPASLWEEETVCACLFSWRHHRGREQTSSEAALMQEHPFGGDGAALTGRPGFG